MGSLEIAFRAPWLQTGPPPKGLEPRVRMRPTSGPHGDSLTLISTWDRSAADGQGAFVVQDVPAGSYETWLFEGSCGASFPFRQGPGWTVTIEPGQRTQVDATDSAIAAVKLELFEVDGEPFERGLSAELLVKETAGRGYMSMAKRTPAFPSAPYLFPLVPVARANRGAGVYVMLNNAFVLPRPSLVSMEGLSAG